MAQVSRSPWQVLTSPSRRHSPRNCGALIVPDGVFILSNLRLSTLVRSLEKEVNATYGTWSGDHRFWVEIRDRLIDHRHILLNRTNVLRKKQKRHKRRSYLRPFEEFKRESTRFK